MTGDWRAAALCAQVDAELFFADVERGAAYEAQVAAAKGVCAVCPVRAECLAFALDALPLGIAGGTTAAERRELVGDRAARLLEVELAELGLPSTQMKTTAAVGWKALRAGQDVDDVARMCGVSRRTAQRWAAQVRNEQETETAA